MTAGNEFEVLATSDLEAANPDYGILRASGELFLKITHPKVNLYS
jgi:hypothetical protein